jgi:hypothetical protein
MEGAMTNRKGRGDEAQAKFIERQEAIEKERPYVDAQRGTDCPKAHKRVKGQKIGGTGQ